jgi:predicted kinase
MKLKGYKMKCYQLIGVPASGKSTWITNQDWAVDIPVVSTDNFVEAYAKEQGKTYNEVFDEYMPTAVKLMANQALICQANGLDVIWDQTSTTINSRKRKFNTLPKYEHIAIVFKTPEKEELDRRLASRPGKNIPDHVMRSMIDGFVMPTEDEGFTEIWHV